MAEKNGTSSTGYDDWKKYSKFYNEDGETASGQTDYNDWKNYSKYRVSDIINNNTTVRLNEWLKKHNDYVSKYQKRYAGRKNSYEDAYVNDSGSWLADINRQMEALEEERQSILAYLDQNKGYIDQDWAMDVRNTLVKGRYAQVGIRDSSAKDHEYWQMFTPNEEQIAAGYTTAEKVYQNWQAEQKQLDYDLAYDVDAGLLELENLKKEKESYLAEQKAKKEQRENEKSIWDKIGEWMGNTPDTSIPLAGASEYVGNISTGNIYDNYGYDKRIADLEAQIERSKYLQGYQGYMENMSANDYGKNSRYESTRTNVAFEDAYWGLGDAFVSTYKLFGDDYIYNYINGHQDALDAATQNNGVNATGADFLGVDDEFLRTMTKDEIGVYNYLYKTQGKEAAGAFVNFISSDLKGRERLRVQALWAEDAKKYPILASAFSTIMSPLKGVSYIGQLADMVDDGKLEENAGYNRFSDIPSAIRTQVSTTIEDSGKWGKVGSFAYNTGMSMADFLWTTAVSGGNQTLSLAIMGTGAAADTTIAAKKRGLDDGEAFTLGTIAGIAEVAAEKISLGAWLEGDLSEGALRYILKNALSEAGEEAGTSVVNLLADVIIAGDKSEWNMAMQAYMAEGKSYAEAFGLVAAEQAAQIGLDALGGALSGGVLGGGTYAGVSGASAIKYFGTTTNKAKSQSLVSEGLELDSKNQYLQKMQNKLDKGKKLTGMQVRNVLAANQELFTADDMKKIQKAAEKRLTELGQTKDVSKVAELATKYATGQKLSKAEKNFLASSEFGSQVAKDLRGENSTDWVEEIGTRVVNAEAYNKKITIEEEPAKYKSITERIGEDGRFGVSESGKATIRATDEEIDINSLDVATVGDGELTFQVGDKEVSAGEIDFADGGQSFLVSAVSEIENITPASATAIMKLVDTSKPVAPQLNAIDEAFTFGNRGYSEADLRAGEFAKNLTDEKLMRAYELGKEARKESDDSKSTKIKKMRTAADAIAEKNAAEGKETPKAKNLTITFNRGNGEVVSIDEAGITEEKRSGGIRVAEILHKMGLGTRVEFFESHESDTLKVKDRKTGELKKARVFINDAGVEQIAYSGVHRKADGTIRVDLNAYNGRGLTLNALAHELTHFIQQWSDTKYKVLVDFLMKEYEKTDMTMHKRVLREQKRLEDIRGKKVSYDEAYDEVVANAMMKMFDDGNLVEKLAKLKEQDKDLAHKLWEGFKEILAKFLDFYEKEGALFRDTEDLMKMKETFEQLQTMFAEALVEASENYQASLITKEAGMDFFAVEDVSQYSYSSLAEAAGFVAAQNEDGTRSFTRDGKKVSEVTVEDIDNSPIGAFINFSVEMKDISEADALRQKEMFAKICTMACHTNDFAMTMQFVGSAVFTGMKANADKQYGTTYDFPSICTKTQAVIDAMSAKMMSIGRGLTSDEIVQLYADVFASGNPVPCPECYVFSRWIGIGGLLDNIKKYQDYYGDMTVEDVAAEYRKMKAEVSKFAEEQGISFGKAKGALTSKLTKEFNKLTEKVEKQQNQGEKVKPADLKRLEELEPMMNTVKGMTWLENVYFADSSLKKVNPKFRVPNEVLFDLNNGEAFASQYKEAWAFRTTQGAGYGKAITPYAEARLGEGVLVTNNTTNAIKGRAQGTLNNYFLNQNGKLDKQSRDALKRARLKQKIQAFLGGQRFQSTSDARYENASDYLLAALEMQAMGGMVQCYTKVDGAVPAFSAWGFSINQSLMPLNGGLDADGNVKDTAVGGMKPSVAFENRNKHESAGTITIGVNDNHIRAMFKQWVRDFIIPYHASGGKADTVAEFRRIQEGKEAKGEAVRSTDYSRTQSDKVLSDEVLRWQGKTDAQIQRIHEIRAARIAILTGSKPNMTVVRSNRFLSALYDKFNGGEWDGVKVAKSKVESQIFPNEFWDQSVSYDESAKITKDYLEYCDDLGFLHRFSGMIPSNGRLVPAKGYDQNGNRVQLTDLAYKYDENGNKTTEVEEFFWKVLTDRRMYDNNGKYLPQKVVTLNDTTADTVTNFAKNNQGRQYDKAKAEALAQKIVKGEQYSPHDVEHEGYDTGNLAWAIDAGIINESDQARFWEAIAEIQKLRYNSFPRTKNGAYIIETVNTMMFTDGDYKAPTLSKVIVFPYGEYVDTSDERTMIRNEARTTGRTSQSTKAIERVSGPGFVTEYYTPHYRADGREISRGEGTNSGRTASQTEGRGVRHDGTDGLQPGQKVNRDFLADDKLKGNYTVSEIGEMFDAWNSDPELTDLSKKVFAKLQEIQDNLSRPASYPGLGTWPYKISFKTEDYMKKEFFDAPHGVFAPRSNDSNYGITYNLDYFKSVSDQEKAHVLLHEAIHACTYGAIKSAENRIPNYSTKKYTLDITPDDSWGELQKAGLELIQVFNQVGIANMGNEYGQKSVHEMVAEMSNPEFRDMLKKQSLWGTIVDAIKRIFGIQRRTAYDSVSNALEKILELDMSKKANEVYSSHDTDIDTSGMDENAKEIIHNLNIRAMGSRYLKGEYASYSAERIARELSNSSANKMDYAKSYIAWVEPLDFLYATTISQENREQIEKEAGELDLERLRKQTQPIHLTVDFETGKIVGHEGRHRMIALHKAGVKKVAVIFDAWNDDRHNTKPVSIKKIGGQEFDRYHGGIDFYVHDMLPLSKRYADAATKLFSEVNGSVRFSGHETDYSNRDLLANAFEGLSQNSEEYKMIQEYKGRIRLLNEQEDKLAKLNAEIRDIRFTKGKYDAKKLKELEAEAKSVAESINRQDRKLLDMEASEPLRKVIEQERKKEALKTIDHVKEIVQNKKLRAERTELRHKIRKTVRDLDKVLNRGNKKQNVKEDMKDFVSKALELADYLFTDHISNDDLIRRGITVRMTPREAALVKETEDILTKLYDQADSLTDEEFTNLDAKRKANEEKLRDLLNAQRNEALNTPVAQLFDDLVKAYASLKNSSQDAVKAAYNEELEKSLRAFTSDDAKVKILENMRVADMTTEELNWLYRAYTMVLTNVRNANKFHVEGMNETIDQKVGRIVSDFGNRKIPNGKVAIVARNLANKMGWDYEKLHYALDRIGSEAFTELIMNLADSENIVMEDIMEAALFRDQMVEKYGFNNWAVNKEIDKEFLDNTGKKFKLTLGQLMSLYAYSRREGAWDHIEYGGFVFGEKALTNPRPADSYKLNKEQCEAITNTLTKEQKAYVEDMQKYLSETMGEKGNEVSMLLYGIKMFGEKNYFPIHIAGEFKAQAQESQAKAAAGFGSMSNAGFTHAQNPNAKAPFVLEGFNEVWSDHVNEMSRYHGTVPALEDIRRVMNRSSYSDAYNESMSVKAVMENAFGKDAVDYFDNLYREANSGAITDKLQKRSKWLLSLFRKNSVAYSLSVLIQQPASVVRAYAMIPRRYFGVKGFGTITTGVVRAMSDKMTKSYTNSYNEMLKYAPGVTMAKEIGGFDTATGGSIRSYLLDTDKSLMQKLKTENAMGKVKAGLDLVDNNPVANLPNLADKIAWIEIWNACKKETVATHKDLAPNSEEFMKAVGERFTEVIRATQVYDSIFAKSPMLKSKNLAVQYLVSFMNEPNTTANMVEKAMRDVARGDFKGGATTAVVVIHSIIFTNLLKSLIYAMRDDDEDETYIEKYIEAVTGNIMSDFNPLNYIPVARDVWSIAQGYDVERSDMAIVADALDALDGVLKNAAKAAEKEDMTEEELIEFDKKVTEANWKLVESLASFFGIPVKNIRREIDAIFDHAKIASANAGQFTKQSIDDTIYEAVIDSIPFMSSKKESKQDKLYDALVSGDKTYVDRLKAGYKDEDAYNSDVRKVLRENDPRIHEAALAYYNGNLAEYKRIFKEIRNDDKRNIIGFDNTMEAVMSEVSAIKGELEGKTESSAYSATDFVNAILVGNADLALTMKEDIISYKVAHGSTQKEAEESFFESVSTSTRNAFDSGLLDETGTEKMLQEYTDMDEEEAVSKVDYWSFIKAHPQFRGDLSEAQVEKYHEFAEPAEIPLDVFVQYLEGTSGLADIKDEWGDVVKSKREQVLEVIDSLPLTWQQKDALYLAANYAESKIWDVPW